MYFKFHVGKLTKKCVQIWLFLSKHLLKRTFSYSFVRNFLFVRRSFEKLWNSIFIF